MIQTMTPVYIRAKNKTAYPGWKQAANKGKSSTVKKCAHNNVIVIYFFECVENMEVFHRNQRGFLILSADLLGAG